MRSRPSLAGRAVTAVALMIGFYVLAFAICAVLGFVMWEDTQHGRIHPKLWLFGGAGILGVLAGVWPRRLTFDDPGIALDPERQPALWQLVREVAQEAEQDAPSQLFLVDDINAFVAERNSRMGFGGERIMGIGLPLMQVLTVPQLRAVIAHEFGHFHGGDTRLGPFIYRTRSSIGRTVSKLKKDGSYLHKPFEWYGNMFLRVTRGISREQEFAADALAVQLTGLEPKKDALRRISETAPLLEDYVQDEYLPALNAGLRPEFAAGFSLYLESEAIRKARKPIAEVAMQAKTDPYDTHPRMPERMAALDEVDRPGAMASEGPSGTSLLQDLNQIEAELLAFMTDRPDVADIKHVPWRDAAARIVLHHWQRVARGAAGNLPALTVGDYAAQTEQLAAHAKAYNDEIPADELVDAGAWLLTTLLNCALVRCGFCAVTGPGDPVRLMKGDECLDTRELGRRLAAGELPAAEWTSLCERLGIGAEPLAGPLAVPPAES